VSSTTPSPAPVLSAAPAAAPHAGFAVLRARLAALPEATGAERRALRDDLVAALASDYLPLRAMAAEALGRIGDHRAAPLLVAAMQDPAILVQWRAGHALEALRAGALVAPERLPPDDPRAFEQWRGRLLDALLRQLDGPAPEERLEAATALAEIAAPATLPGLLPALFDSEAPVRWEISRAALAITAAHPDLRAPAAAQVMRAVHDGEPLNRQIGAEFLGRLGDPSAIPTLVTLSHDAAALVRWAACAALGALGDPTSTATLILRLADDDLWVRCSAAGALARIGARFAVPPLLQVSRDEQPVVRQAVVAALGAIGGPEAQAAVRRALRDRDPGVRLAAVQALERSGDQQAFKALGALGRDRARVGEVRISRAAGAARQAISARYRGAG
jgi:HEAT repeat protein